MDVWPHGRQGTLGPMVPAGVGPVGPWPVTGTTGILAVHVHEETMPGSHARRHRPLSALAGLIAVLVLAGPVLAEDPSPSPSPTPTPSPSPSASPAPSPGLTWPVTFHGRGWGHGVGMSQYGARGRALAGQDAASILAHYYAGTTPATVDPAQLVRVLLAAAHRPTSTLPLRVTGRRGTWTIDGIAKTFPVDAVARLGRRLTTSGTYTWRLVVRSAAGTVLHSGAAPTSVRIRPAAGSSARFQVGFKPASSDTYRGVLRLLPKSNGTAVAINELALDLYLRGVVPVEMPSSWPAEALKVQAVAARSYAVRHLRPGVGMFDVYDDTRSQVYRGVRAERTPTNAAIAASAGQVLKSGSSVASTVFHSTAGGATEHNENVWTSSSGALGTPVSYLRGVSDRAPDGTPYDAGAPYATWKTASYSAEALSAIFAADPRTNVGTITALDLSRRGVSGRLISVTLTGTAGSRTVSGEVFRSVFNKHSPLTDPALRSTYFDLAPIP